ncbi:MAG TPA: hypothetical protein VMN43_11720 [Aestuariivirgaceae bacterium]|nr:hypothetical protein [Aestuariivirgaceae bacterium]
MEHVKPDRVVEHAAPRQGEPRQGEPRQGAPRQGAPRQGAPRKLRRRYLRTNYILFLATFMLPLVVLSAYLLFLASNRYESLALTTITEEKPSASSVDLSVLGITSTVSDKDSLILKAFIESRDMLLFIDEKLRLREHVTQPTIDFYSRLDEDATIEDFHEYYLWLIQVEYDTSSKLISFGVQAFDEEFAHSLLQLIVEQSQQFIDRLNEQVTREQMRFFDIQIAETESRLKQAKEELIAFQRENRLMTTEGESQTIMATIQTLEQGLAQKQSDLSARLQVLDKTAPQLQTLQLDITALESQIASAKERLAGSSDTSISELDAQFREIQLNLEFITNIYTSNLSALEQARVEAVRRLKFLIVVSQPSTAEQAEYPQQAYIIATAGVILMVLYFVLSLTVAIIREHN